MRIFLDRLHSYSIQKTQTFVDELRAIVPMKKAKNEHKTWKMKKKTTNAEILCEKFNDNGKLFY